MVVAIGGILARPRREPARASPAVGLGSRLGPRDNAAMTEDPFAMDHPGDLEWAGLIERHDSALAALKEPGPEQDYRSLYDEWESATQAIRDHLRRIHGDSGS